SYPANTDVYTLSLHDALPISEKNIQTVKNFFAAIGRGDRESLLALVAEDIEWIIPGEDWPLAGTRHGHAGLADLVMTASETMERSEEHTSELQSRFDLVCRLL